MRWLTLIILCFTVGLDVVFTAFMQALLIYLALVLLLGMLCSIVNVIDKERD